VAKNNPTCIEKAVLLTWLDNTMDFARKYCEEGDNDDWADILTTLEEVKWRVASCDFNGFGGVSEKEMDEFMIKDE
jgi:hypothetical protein